MSTLKTDAESIIKIREKLNKENWDYHEFRLPIVGTPCWTHKDYPMIRIGFTLGKLEICYKNYSSFYFKCKDVLDVSISECVEAVIEEVFDQQL